MFEAFKALNSSSCPLLTWNKAAINMLLPSNLQALTV